METENNQSGAKMNLVLPNSLMHLHNSLTTTHNASWASTFIGVHFMFKQFIKKFKQKYEKPNNKSDLQWALFYYQIPPRLTMMLLVCIWSWFC